MDATNIAAFKIGASQTGNIMPAASAAKTGHAGLKSVGGGHVTAGELAAPTPKPSTLAIGGLSLPALGARGVRELRRRREQAAKN